MYLANIPGFLSKGLLCLFDVRIRYLVLGSNARQMFLGFDIRGKYSSS